MTYIKSKKTANLNSPTASLQKTDDDATLAKLSAQRIELYMHSVAKTRRQVAQHCHENLGIPAAPCLDILLVLQVSDGASLSLESIADHICNPASMTLRYLNLMVKKGLIEVDRENVQLTSNGANQLLNIMGQLHADYLEQVE